MEKKQAVVTSDTLTKEQIRELAAKSLQMYLNEEITANFPPDTPNESLMR